MLSSKWAQCIGTVISQYRDTTAVRWGGLVVVAGTASQAIPDLFLGARRERRRAAVESR
jgi:hypothetical protein